MTRAFYRGYVDGAARAGQVCRLHIMREDHPTFPGRIALCGVHGWDVTRSTTVIFDELPQCAPDGLGWCPTCVGRHADTLGLLDSFGARLTAADRADIAEDAAHVRLADGNEDHL